MKKYKQISIAAKPAVAAKVETVFDKVICDMCGSDIYEESDVYEVNEVKISHKYGAQYPEGGSGETISFDICHDCFTNEISKWLIEKGCTPTKDSWDW